MGASRKRSSRNPNLLTTKEAAAYLGVTPQTIYNMTDRGEITPLVPPGDYIKPPVRYFRREDLDTVYERRWQALEPKLVTYVSPKRQAALAAQQADRPAGSVA